jgi:hypothetical protein
MSTRSSLALVVERVGHPLLLAGALALCWSMGRSEATTLVALVLAMRVRDVLERIVPAVPHRRRSAMETVRLAGVYLLFLVVCVAVVAACGTVLVPAFVALREGLGGAPWPTRWPPVAQVLLLLVAADLIDDWIHRAIHRSTLLWRISGHGFHHGFKNLQAIHVGANHPFEVADMVLPAAFLGAAFGAPGDVAAGIGALAIGTRAPARAASIATCPAPRATSRIRVPGVAAPDQALRDARAIASASRSGSSEPTRKRRPPRSRSSTPRVPDTFQSQPCGVQRMPQP